MKILFLDIDGVLNGHQILSEAGCCGIDKNCIGFLNKIVQKTSCKIVLTSAWRYMIHQKAMSLSGFWYMLRTHGFTNNNDINPIIGLTRKDKNISDPNERGRQILDWLGKKKVKYCALDDQDLGYSHYKIPLVQTDGKVGITQSITDRVIEILSD